jgi:spectrin alpha
MGKWRSLLGHSQSLQHFKREADEAAAWMGEKMQVACDDSYKDPTNLPVSACLFVVVVNLIVLIICI